MGCGSIRRGLTRLSAGRVKASLTVEAVLVVPLVLFILFGIMVFSLVQRDRTAAAAAVLYSAESARTRSAEECRSLLAEALEDMLVSPSEGGSVEQGAKDVKVSAQIRTRAYFVGQGGSYTASVRQHFPDPVRFLRLCAVAEEAAGRK